MFRKHRTKAIPPPQINGHELENNNVVNKSPPESPIIHSLQFYCQLAHGSPTAFVSGFSNVKELYKKIGDAFDMPESEIIFCTLNTYKPDMKKLLGGQIGLEDFIFAHKKGTPKEVELVKSEDSLGLTITDNGAGYAFIKRIKEGSVISNIPHIKVGDHIERLDGHNMVGKRHYEVASALKNIPVGATFTIRLVEPMSSGFGQIAPKGSTRGVPKKAGYGTGYQTLRFKAGGQAELQDQDDSMDLGIDKINSVLESFMGINDAELATQIWELSEGKKNSMEFADAIDDSDLAAFEFTDELIIELWGCVTDARQRRYK
ncbi:PDZ domain-containing protein GIPC1 [Anthonomus grandis grandis]|uniref:PDZ domain-containing protein GIPC1 n=1 Tax=Anthonomus grandis grandis TaxID=2921223 RepID=UPI0021654A84|nr:PDZ domain-containing protein GIPC1 [Anthonomus grandis grandis]XP_050303452.1 PDZ domain-containing protein GIPC1 [Anthonomus grandis grandis]XP_050303453.1 PDZ domain-containing protein GIPC1 [Anthonomus grandis grandis]